MTDFAPCPRGSTLPGADPAAPPDARRRRLLAALLACGVPAQAAARPPKAGEPARPVGRVPPSAWPQGLPAGVRAALASAGLPPDSIGLMVQSVAAGAPPLAALNTGAAFQLASTTKLVTALAALSLLGPHYRWRTSAHLAGSLHQGRLAGDLHIVGGGNALLRSDELQAWFGQMQSQGLQEVLGDIVLDRGAFRLQAQDFADTPLPAVDRPHHAWPDALTLDEGRLRVSVLPGVGGPARISLWPALAGVRLDSQVAGTGCNLHAQWRAPPPADRGADPSLVLRGQWGRRCGPGEVQLSPLMHDEYTARALQGLWRGAGGRLRGRVLDLAAAGRQADRWAGLPGREVAAATGLAAPGIGPAWSVHQSEPLSQLVRDINKHSDNLAARNLMLSLSPGFPQQAATLAGARERLAGWLAQQGLGPDELWVDNGSGLSRAERGTPRAMVQLLRGAWGTAAGQTLLDSLPVAGVDGTLAHRLQQGRATGRAFLKTGSLLDTRALAGYVQGSGGTVWALAVMVNHPEAGRATPALDRLVEWLAAQG